MYNKCFLPVKGYTNTPGILANPESPTSIQSSWKLYSAILFGFMLLEIYTIQQITHHKAKIYTFF